VGDGGVGGGDGTCPSTCPAFIGLSVSRCSTSGALPHLPSSSDFGELKDVMLVFCEPRENSVVAIVETPAEDPSYHGEIDNMEDMEDKTRERRL